MTARLSNPNSDFKSEVDPVATKKAKAKAKASKTAPKARAAKRTGGTTTKTATKTAKKSASKAVAKKTPAKTASKAVKKKPAAKKAPAKTAAKSTAAKKPSASKTPAAKAPAAKRKTATATAKAPAAKSTKKPTVKTSKKTTAPAAKTKVGKAVTASAKPASTTAGAQPAKASTAKAAVANPVKETKARKTKGGNASQQPVSATPNKKVAALVFTKPKEKQQETPMTKPRRLVNLEGVDLPEGYTPSPKDEYMNPQHLVYFRNKLLNWRSELIEESQETLEHLRTESRDVGDEAERASRESDNILELRTRDRYRKLLRKIEQALERIEDGSYGYCEETGEEIGLGRLEARPIATLTIDAQERRELLQRQFRDD
ncbi:MAG: RNA polymerase-binding protein DksA [Gammaproteobacteria bacterium]|nr:RNA polymerase-binding protein DksA [Gammaproteobacteria bacterium]